MTLTCGPERGEGISWMPPFDGWWGPAHSHTQMFLARPISVHICFALLTTNHRARGTFFVREGSDVATLS